MTLDGPLADSYNGYDQYNDTDINAARLAFSITAFALMPSNILLNLLIIIIIYVFRSLRTIQNTFVASASLHNLLSGVICIPLYALFWIPKDILDVDASNKYVCISFFASITSVGFGTTTHIAMISADRFFAVVYPVKYLRVMSITKALRIIIAVWVLAIFASLLQYVWNDYKEGECEITLTVAPSVRFFSSPIFGICILMSVGFNSIVFCKAFKFKQRRRTLKSQKNTFPLLLQLCYFVLWIPYLGSLTPRFAFGVNTKAVLLAHTITSTCVIWYYSISPLIYIFVRKQARVAIKCILKTPPWRWSELSFSNALGDVETPQETTQQTNGVPTSPPTEKVVSLPGCFTCCPAVPPQPESLHSEVYIWTSRESVKGRNKDNNGKQEDGDGFSLRGTYSEITRFLSERVSTVDPSDSYQTIDSDNENRDDAGQARLSQNTQKPTRKQSSTMSFIRKVIPLRSTPT